MGVKLFLVSAVIAAASFYVYKTFTTEPAKADWPTTGYYGPGKPKKDNEAIRPFKINVPEAQIQDLKTRLKNAKISHDDLEDVNSFEYGFTKKALTVYVNSWLNEYNWRTVETQLNKFNHFKTEIEGIDLHFIHTKPDAQKYKTIIPILLSHGWPGSVYEFFKITPILTDPKAHGINSEFAFEVVTPSIPGFGWSSASSKTGMNSGAVARIFHKLMNRLKLHKYVVQGGDWGSPIVSNIARLYPNEVVGIHLNMLFSQRLVFIGKSVLASLFPSLVLGDVALKDFNFFSTLKFMFVKGGYFHVQATTPDTLGIGLNDSPVGLLAWMLEKYIGGTNIHYAQTIDGNQILKKFTKEELLTFVSIYWFNGNMLQSTRFYKENIIDDKLKLLTKQYISTPTGYAAVANDPVPILPEAIAKTAANITHYSYVEDLGHFAAFEGPKPLATDIFSFVKSLKL